MRKKKTLQELADKMPWVDFNKKTTRLWTEANLDHAISWSNSQYGLRKYDVLNQLMSARGLNYWYAEYSTGSVSVNSDLAGWAYSALVLDGVLYLIDKNLNKCLMVFTAPKE